MGKSSNLAVNFYFLKLEKNFRFFVRILFLEINKFLLKKSYILWKTAPFMVSGTLRVLETRSGPGPGNAKSLKTGSGSGIHMPGTRGYPGI